MAPNPGFLAHVRDCLAGVGPVTTRNMFGGAGVYADGVMFALVAYDVLYFKADGESSAAFEAEGCGPFTYEGKAKPVRMSYWEVPERLFDDAEEMTAWAERALAVARKAKHKKAPRKRATGKTADPNK